MMLAQLEPKVVPPINVGSVAQALQVPGRYEVEWSGCIEWLDTEVDLRSWLKFCEAGPLLVDRAVAQVKAVGLCVLKFKGITIRDTHWVKPLSTIDWSMFKSK